MTKNNPLCHFLLLAALLLALPMWVSCNKSDDNDDDSYTYSESEMTTLITAFGLQDNSNVMVNLDSVYFTVDHDAGLIYNADSLPVGTNVTKLTVTIDFLNTVKSAVFTVKGGKVQSDTTINYTTSSTDSIDFTGNVVLTVTSYDGTRVKDYTVKVNVHKVEPDAMVWPTSWCRILPGYSVNASEQRTVQQGDYYHSLVHVGDRYVLTTSSSPNQSQWAIDTLDINFTPDVSSFAATSYSLFVLDLDGNLYTSDDGENWVSCDTKWFSVLGSYEDRLLGIASDGSTYYHDEFPRPAGFVPTVIEDYFPIMSASQLVHADNSWTTSSQSMLVGGIDRRGKVVGDVWGYDGTKWGVINDTHGKTKLPAMYGATLFPYYRYIKTSGTLRYKKHITWYVLGGRFSDGTLNDSVYVSNNQGINWAVADSALQMPELMRSFYDAQAFVCFETLTASKQAPRRVSQAVISWECPYVYLFGGCDQSGDLLPFLWRGVYTRMTFYPLY